MIDKIKTLSDKLQWFHVLLILAAGGGFFYYTLDRSELELKRQSLTSTQNEITSLDRKVQEAKEFEKQVDEKKRRLSDLTKNLLSMQSSLPRQFFLPDLMNDILKEAKQVEVDVSSIIPDSREENRDLYSSLGFTLDVKGTFIQFLVLFDRIAHLKKVMGVASFTLDLDSDRKAVVLGGEDGAFAASKLQGGRSVYPGIRSSLKIVSYRYKGTGQ